MKTTIVVMSLIGLSVPILLADAPASEAQLSGAPVDLGKIVVTASRDLPFLEAMTPLERERYFRELRILNPVPVVSGPVYYWQRGRDR